MNAAQLTDLDLRLLRVLDTLLETESVSRAALKLGVSPSAVSHSLKDLRTRFGDPMFVRNGGVLRPTPRANSIKASLRKSLIGLRDVMHRDATFDPAKAQREFSLAASDFITGRLWRMIEQLQWKAPGIRVALLSIEKQVHEQLANGELDIVLAAGLAEQFLALDREMIRVTAFSDRLVCIARSGNPLLTDGMMSAHQYTQARHIFISVSGHSTGLVDAELAKRGLARQIAVRLSTSRSAIRLVENTDLVATVPQTLVDAAGAEGRVVCFPPPIDLPIGEGHLWWHERFQHDPGHVWWRTTVLKALNEAMHEAPSVLE